MTQSLTVVDSDGPVLHYFDWPLFDFVSLHSHTFPAYSMETNTAFTTFLDDKLESVSNWIGVVKKNDHEPLLRTAIFFGSIYLHWATTYYSHEIGHSQNDYNRCGFRQSCRLGMLDFTNWGDATVPYFVKPIQYTTDPLSDIRSTLNGLDQQQLNADYYFREAVIADRFSLDDAFSYAFNDFADVAYHSFLREPKYDIPKTKEEFRQILHRDIDTTDWFVLSALSSFLNFHNWESLWLMANYLSSGKRSGETLSLKTDNVALYPPHFSLHMSVEGYYLNMESPIKLSEGVLFFLNFGSVFYNSPEYFRAGGRFYLDLSSSDRKIYVQPELFLNFEGENYKGVRAGLATTFEIGSGYEVTLGGICHKGDFVSEDIMGYGVTYPPKSNHKFLEGRVKKFPEGDGILRPDDKSFEEEIVSYPRSLSYMITAGIGRHF